MNRVIMPLKKMGARVINLNEKLTLPLTIIPGKEIIPIDYEMPIASAQVKSSILIAGSAFNHETIVIETDQTRNHTEKMLGLPVKVIDGKIGSSSSIKDIPKNE